MEQNSSFDNFFVSENSVNETYDPFSDPTNTTLEELIDQVVFPESTTKEYSPSTASRLYPSPPPPPVPTVEVAQKPPPAYENFAQKSRASTPTNDQSSRLSPKNSSRRMYQSHRVRSGPYEKYKDESGKIQVDQIADPEERERVLEKREKNRIAAEKARTKKKTKIDFLEGEKRRLSALIDAEDAELMRKRRKLDLLKVSFQEHEKVCSFKQSNRSIC